MGVKQLWKLLAPVGRRVDIETLRGKILAVDASIWLTQFVKAMRSKEDGRMLPNAHIIGSLRRILKLLHCKIKPLFVFDGGVPVLKRRIMNARRQKQDHNKHLVTRAAQKLLLNQLLAQKIEGKSQKKAEDGPKFNLPPEPTKKNPAGATKALDTTLESESSEDDEDLPLGICWGERKATEETSEKKQEQEQTENNGDEDYEEVAAQAQDIVEQLPVKENGDLDLSMVPHLPQRLQYEVLARLKDKRRQRESKRNQFIPVAGNPQKYSELQLAYFIKDTSLKKKLDSMESNLASTGGDGKRIASDAQRQYVLIDTKAAKKNPASPVKKPPLELPPAPVARPLPPQPATSRPTAPAKKKTSSIAASLVTSLTNERQQKDLQQKEMQESASKKRRIDDATKLMELMQKKRKIAEQPPTKQPSTGPKYEVQGDKVRISFSAADLASKKPDAFLSKELLDAFLQPVQVPEKKQEKPLQRPVLSRSYSSESTTQDMSLMNNEKTLSSALNTAAGLTSWAANAVRRAVKKRTANLQEQPEIKKTPAVAMSVDAEDENNTNDRGEWDSNSEASDEADGGKPIHIIQQPLSKSSAEQDTVLDLSDSPIMTKPMDLSDSPVMTKQSVMNVPNSPDHVEENVVNLISPEITTKTDPKLESSATKKTDEDDESFLSAKSAESGAEEFMSAKSKDEGLFDSEGVTSPQMPSKKEKEEVKVGRSKLLDFGKVDREQVPGSVSTTVIDDDDEEEKREEEEEEEEEFVSISQNKSDDEFKSLSQKSVPSVSQGSLDFLESQSMTSTQHSFAESDVIDMEDEVEYVRNMQTEITQQQQKQQMQQTKQVTEEQKHEIVSNLNKENADLMKQRNLAQRDAETVTPLMLLEVKELLDAFNLPYIDAPMEAEAECAALEMSKVVDGVITDDCDAFLFGARTVYKNIFDEKKWVEAYKMSDVERELALDRDGLIKMALLLGSDYTMGIKGIGVVNASEIAQNFENLTDFRKWVNEPYDPATQKKDEKKRRGDAKAKKKSKKARKTSSDEEDEGEEDEDEDDETTQKRIDEAALEKYKKSHAKMRKKWVVPDTFPSIVVIDAYKKPIVSGLRREDRLHWEQPDEEKIHAFCSSKLGWTREHINAQISGPLRSFKERSIQTSMDSFVISYKDESRFAAIRSKRMQEAVRGLRQNKGLKGKGVKFVNAAGFEVKEKDD